MKIEKNVLDALNAQINREYYSAYLYLSMSFYCHDVGLQGFAHWLNIQKLEECGHADLLIHHIQERGGKIELSAIEIPPNTWENIVELFKSVLEHERSMTAAVHNLVTTAQVQNDFPVQSLLKWFVDEQVEEESEAENILNQLNYVKENTSAIFILDRELAKRTKFEMNG